jgi:hypothetical protein
MYISAEGIDQPHKIDLIEDYRYSVRGPKAQVMDNHPLPDASVKYLKGTVKVQPEKTEVISLGNDRYKIEFPYEDKAEWLTVKGKYCREDWDRFGKSTTFQFLETMRCEHNVVTTSTPTKTTTTTPAKTTTTTQTTTPSEPEEGPKEEVTLVSLIKWFFGLFRK